ncbi:PREDICTED: hemicentin-1-like, partial [Amphimedon queenslandica]|uniref:Ig-like domain-containing protein n=2 Tax=Amphimedon queenslandica TaxID=400682 RepID=A0AAN0JXK6_AMPQE
MLKGLAFIAAVLVTLTYNEVKSQTTVTITGPAIVTKNFGDSVTFECIATGLIQSLSVHYAIGFYNEAGVNVGGQELNNNVATLSRSLTINNIGRGDVGKYTCRLTIDVLNPPSTSKTDTVTLQVSPENNVTVDRAPAVSVKSGDNLTLTCSTPAGPSNSFTWYFYEDPCDPDLAAFDPWAFISTGGGDMVGNETVYMIDSVDNSTDGCYICNVTNGAGSGFNATTVYIAPNITLHPDPIVTTEINGNVTLSCDADASPFPTFQWEKKDTSGDFVELPGETNNELEIISVKFEDAGEYRCVVTANGTLNSIASDVSTVYVSPDGSVIIEPSFLIAEYGSSPSFTCTTMAGPNNAFYWYYNISGAVCNEDCTGTDESFNDFLSNINSSINLTLVGTDPVLTLSNIDSSVGGTYHCVVVNEAGFDIETATLYITPTIVTHPMSVNTSTGSSVNMLSCVADSFPDPEYRWERSSTNEGPYTEIANSKGSTYDLGTIVYTTNGFFRCIAYTNISNIINETASNPAIVSVSPAGSVMIFPFSATVSGGTNVTFTCSAGGGPGNTFAWRHNANEISDGGRFIIESTSSSTLTVTDVIGADFGTYICQVSNLAGSDTATSRITTSPEGFSTISPVNNITLDRGDDITLNCATTAGPPSNIMYDWYHNATQSVCCPFGQDANIT